MNSELCEAIVSGELCDVIVDEQCVWNGDCVWPPEFVWRPFLSDIAGYAVVDAG